MSPLYQESIKKRKTPADFAGDGAGHPFFDGDLSRIHANGA